MEVQNEEEEEQSVSVWKIPLKSSGIAERTDILGDGRGSPSLLMPCCVIMQSSTFCSFKRMQNRIKHSLLCLKSLSHAAGRRSHMPMENALHHLKPSPGWQEQKGSKSNNAKSKECITVPEFFQCCLFWFKNTILCHFVFGIRCRLNEKMKTNVLLTSCRVPKETL